MSIAFARPSGPAAPSVFCVDTALYDEVGGHPTFVRLVETFYARVAADPVLSRMYPQDLSGPTDRMVWFLEEYWGGPPSYSARRGHPALRMRHQPYRLDDDARDRWLRCMLQAIDSLELAPQHADALREQMISTARFLQNVRSTKDDDD